MVSNDQDPCHFKLCKNMRGQLKSMLSGDYFQLKPFKSILTSPKVDHGCANMTLGKKLQIKLKKIEYDEDCFIECKNGFDILSQLHDLCEKRSEHTEQKVHTNQGENIEQKEKSKRKRRQRYETKEKVDDSYVTKNRLDSKQNYHKSDTKKKRKEKYKK